MVTAGFLNHQRYHLPPSTQFFAWQPVSSGSSQANAILLVVVLVTFTLRGTPGNLAGGDSTERSTRDLNGQQQWHHVYPMTGWWFQPFNPSEKYESKCESSPNRDEHKTYLSCHHPDDLLSSCIALVCF